MLQEIAAHQFTWPLLMFLLLFGNIIIHIKLKNGKHR